jgi:Tol biopolymer transport system component
MAIGKGSSLGPYEIMSHIGAGGMGEVWRARDHRIRRDVAVKVLPQEFAAGDDRVKRFEQEARAAGRLNHPGLVTIYDVGTTGGMPYIVMELLEGQTLREALEDAAPAPLPLRKTIDYAVQIADALAVAHANGIIHRDLKPENLFVTTDGRVKILDFGLAKLAADIHEADGRSGSGRGLTSTGMVVGTPGYMSPEQVRAAAVDHRTDIFSFGAVLYEMITGQRAFDRPSAVETMHAVLSDEPAALEAPIPAALEATLHRCLEKDPRRRFQSAADLAFHLQTLADVQRSRTGTGAVPIPRPLRSAMPFRIVAALALVLALAAGALLWRVLRGARPAPPRTYQQLTSADGMETFPTFAPDGKSFAYVSSQTGNRDIYVQRVDGRIGMDITAESGADDSEPAFSPDGAQIAFRSERGGGGIFVMGVAGDSPRRLTNFGHNPSWSPDGTKLVFATEDVEMSPSVRGRSSELWTVDLATSTPRPLVQAGKGGPDFGRDSDAVQPSWSPHGKRIAFWGIALRPSGPSAIWTIDPNAAEPKKTVVRVTSDTGMHWNPVWSPDGKYLYYGSDGDGTLNLWRMAIDEETGRPGGAPESMALPASVTGDFAFAKSGELAYVAVTSLYRILALPLDAEAGTLGPYRQLFSGSQTIVGYQPSPDGTKIAYTKDTGTEDDIFIADADGVRTRQLTQGARDRAVQWAADGETLYFHSPRGGTGASIWSVRADGSGLTRITTEAEVRALGAISFFQPVPSPDGRTLVVQTDRETSVLVHLDRPPGQRIEPLPVFLPTPRWSPDGRFIVARNQRVMSAQLVRKNDLPGAVVLYSLEARRAEKLADRGVSPHWTPDGKKIIYFERQEVRILDLATRSLKIVPFTLPGSARVDLRDASRVSRDARTLYVLQSVQQGDIWMVRLPTDR